MMKFHVLLMVFALPILSFASSSSTCQSEIKPFLHDLQLQCPTTIMYSWPIEINEDSLERLLSSTEYVAILFYASWCPFSTNVKPKFAALSSMFPQIKHVMIEQSSVLPIVFSRYGIHGVPSILMVNRATRVRHSGPKELHSLVHFYKKSTGLEPLMYLTEDQIDSSENKSKNPESCNQTLIKNTINEEPYLTFSLLFLFSKALLYLYPNMVSSLITLWLTYIPHLNLGIFGESRQLLARVLHVVDIKRAFSKLKLSKSGNFQNGARSARAWASSLASFSLGKTCSGNASQGGDL